MQSHGVAKTHFGTRLARAAITLGVLAVAGFAQPSPAPQDKEPPSDQPPVGEWRRLFDGQSLKGWKETPFTARGKVRVENGALILGAGYMTGVTWTEWFPKSNYEVRLEAARLEGSDFFAGITFPVKDSYCTWINGGWGGGVVGLSSIDGQDASENETSSFRQFERGRWYALQLRVTDDEIEAWIDGEEVIYVALEGRTIGLRFGEIELSVPFGIATYSTTGAIRNLEYRLLPPPAKPAADP
ncbi:MAG: DUF1080 domain-containing protein [Bryobacteraceae bacterium]|nr:DUF1080 domain-containing protein [Bryobacteraceae bacterium]